MPTTRKLAAIMFTDIVGYTTLMGKDEDHAFEVLRKNREIHTTFIDKYNGTLIKEMGDGMLTQFNSATDAVQCAIDIQEKVREALEGQIRIGIHLGDITFENEDVFGDGVNIASRLQAIADPGGIYISESIHEAIRSKIDIQSQYLGEIQLKNVDHLVRTYFIKGIRLPIPSTIKRKGLVGDKKSVDRRSTPFYKTAFRRIIKPITDRKRSNKDEKSIRSIAVLPIENLSKNSEEEWLTAGIHHALIDELSKIHALRVVSCTSCLRYHDTDMTIPEIAQDLNVNGIVEASYLTRHENVKIQIRLIQIEPDERQIWMQSYDRTMENVLSIYSDVAKTIAKASNITLTSLEESHISKETKVSPDAYEAFLRGMNHWEKLTESELERALGYFEQSKDIDANYALAYTGVAMVWFAQMQQGFRSKSESLPKVMEAANKALELDSSIVELHWLLAGVKCNLEWDWEGAGSEYKRLFEINPNCAIAHAYYSHYLAVIGHSEKGLYHSELAMKLDPFNALYQSLHGMALKNARKFDEALVLLRKTLEIEPNDRIALPALWTLFHKRNMYEEALEIVKTLYAAKRDYEAIRILEQGNKEGGYKTAMRRTAEMMVARRDTTFVTPFQIGTLYTRAGMKEEAMHWLEKAYEVRDPNMIYIGVDPLFDFLREDVRFKNILQKMNLPEQF